MRLSYILENISILKHQKQLEKVSNKMQQPLQYLINNLNSIDHSGKYTSWILKQIYYNNIIIPEDNARIQETLQNFTKLQPRLEIKDINKYPTIHDLEEILEPHLNTGSKRSGGLQINPSSLPGIELVNTKGDYKTYKITNPESLSILGEGTKWCTRKSYKPCQAKRYIKDHNYIFMITNKNTPFIQYTPDYNQIKDVKDNDIINKQLLQTLILPPNPQDTENVYNYIINVTKDRWPKAEPYIMQSPKWAYHYAYNVIKGRWLEAEPHIAKDPKLAYLYALNVIKGRWPEAEQRIKKSPRLACSYAMNIIEGRWLEAEPYIKKSPQWACDYAVSVLKDRWLEAEQRIMKDPQWAHIYAKNVLKDRWPEAEPYIMQDPESAYHYAMDVIKGRWPEAEQRIKKSPLWFHFYNSNIIKP